MRERLAGLGVADQDRRDFVVEERSGDSAVPVCDVQTVRRVLLHALVEIAFEVGRAVLVGVHLIRRG